MKGIYRKKYLLITIFLLCIIGWIVLFVPFRSALIFYQENTEQVAAFLPIKEGEEFQLIFKHSIHLKDVTEKYVVNKQQSIRQTEIIFEEFGIGMPANAQDGEEFSYENGKYHIKNLNNQFQQIKLRNGKVVSENRLVWGEHAENQIYLNEFFKPGDWFTLKIENLTLWQFLKGMRIHE